MLHSYVTTQRERDKDAQRNHRRRPFGCFLLCCCAACVLVAVGAVVVLSLIPLYLKSPVVQIVDDADNSDFLSTEYVTEYEFPIGTALTELGITNTDELTKQFNNALKLEPNILSVYAASITPKSSRAIHGVGRRRRLVSCDSTDALAVGSRVRIGFKIQYPRRCRGNAACKTKILKNCKTRLENLDTITILISVGTKQILITINIRICSVAVEPKGRTTTTIGSTISTAELTTKYTGAVSTETTAKADTEKVTSTSMTKTAASTPTAPGTATSTSAAPGTATSTSAAPGTAASTASAKVTSTPAATTKTATTSTPTTATTPRTITTTARATTTTLPSSSTVVCYDSSDYYEPVTGHTCQTYIDYGFCNGSSVVANAGIDATLAQVNCCFCGKGIGSKNG